MSGEIKVLKISPTTGSDVTMGDSGDTFTFPAGTTVVSSGDATGFGSNAPAWHVGINSTTQAIPDASMTIVELDDVKFNSGFTWDTSGYKGTPGTAGKYLIGCSAYVDPSGTTAGNVFVHLYKNASSIAYWGFNDAAAIHYEDVIHGSTIVDLGATDYVQLQVYIDIASGSTNLLQYSATQCVTYMYGMKLMGV
jgi:hypothetical protein